MPDPAVPELPSPAERREGRSVVLAAVIGGGTALVAAIVGLTVLGWHTQGQNEVAITGLAAIGSTLAGGFAGWIARGQIDRRREP